jgi:hypothetical protein
MVARNNDEQKQNKIKEPVSSSIVYPISPAGSPNAHPARYALA